MRGFAEVAHTLRTCGTYVAMMWRLTGLPLKATGRMNPGRWISEGRRGLDRVVSSLRETRAGLRTAADGGGASPERLAGARHREWIRLGVG